jgi:hypothetical protein
MDGWVESKVWKRKMTLFRAPGSRSTRICRGLNGTDLCPVLSCAVLCCPVLSCAVL